MVIEQELTINGVRDYRRSTAGVFNIGENPERFDLNIGLDRKKKKTGY